MLEQLHSGGAAQQNRPRVLDKAEPSVKTGSPAVHTLLKRPTLCQKHRGLPAAHRCQLTSEPQCQRFAVPAINRWLADLFQALPHAIALAGLPKVLLFLLHSAVVASARQSILL